MYTEKEFFFSTKKLCYFFFLKNITLKYCSKAIEYFRILLDEKLCNF